MSVLRLTYEPEDEWHGELHVSVEAHGISGQASAWFTREALTAFSQALGQYPLPSHTPVAIAGGVEDFSHENVGIAVSPVGARGKLLVQVDLARERTMEGMDIQQRAVVSFLTEYAALDEFRMAIASMPNGGPGAVLTGIEG